jgi:hypothetical protein
MVLIFVDSYRSVKIHSLVKDVLGVSSASECVTASKQLDFPGMQGMMPEFASC